MNKPENPNNNAVLSCVRLFAAPWTVARQAPPSVEFSRQEYWSERISTPGDLPNPGIKPRSLTLQPDSLHLSHQGSPHYLLLDTLEKFEFQRCGGEYTGFKYPSSKILSDTYIYTTIHNSS